MAGPRDLEPLMDFCLFFFTEGCGQTSPFDVYTASSLVREVCYLLKKKEKEGLCKACKGRRNTERDNKFNLALSSGGESLAEVSDRAWGLSAHDLGLTHGAETFGHGPVTICPICASPARRRDLPQLRVCTVTPDGTRSVEERRNRALPRRGARTTHTRPARRGGLSSEPGASTSPKCKGLGDKVSR